jgi:hypothetical protein
MKNRGFSKRLIKLSLLYSLILFVMPFFSLPSINVSLLQTQQQTFLLLRLTQDSLAQIQTTETTENDFLNLSKFYLWNKRTVSSNVERN